jgi:hypothetical protein
MEERDLARAHFFQCRQKQFSNVKVKANPVEKNVTWLTELKNPYHFYKSELS